MHLLRKSLQSMAITAALVAGATAQTDSRLAEIAAQQEEKAAQAQPEKPGKIERAMIQFRDRDMMRRFAAGIGGVHLKLGGLGAGTGFGIGPEYRRTGVAG